MSVAQRSGQAGVSLGGLLVIMFFVVIIGIFALKLIPPYIEYAKCKAAITAIAQDRSKTGSVAEVRRASMIDDINAVKEADLEVTKEGNDVVISFAYRKEIPLVANAGIYIDFAASSRP